MLYLLSSTFIHECTENRHRAAIFRFILLFFVVTRHFAFGFCVKKHQSEISLNILACSGLLKV